MACRYGTNQIISVSEPCQGLIPKQRTMTESEKIIEKTISYLDELTEFEESYLLGCSEPNEIHEKRLIDLKQTQSKLTVLKQAIIKEALPSNEIRNELSQKHEDYHREGLKQPTNIKHLETHELCGNSFADGWDACIGKINEYLKQ